MPGLLLARVIVRLADASVEVRDSPNPYYPYSHPTPNLKGMTPGLLLARVIVRQADAFVEVRVRVPDQPGHHTLEVRGRVKGALQLLSTRYG